MALAMSYFGMVAAALLVLLFGLDLATGAPFGGANSFIDIAFVVGGLILGYMSWDALKVSK